MDTPSAENKGHALRECAGRGVCDRGSGECQCFAGYGGVGCRRAMCPSNELAKLFKTRVKASGGNATKGLDQLRSKLAQLKSADDFPDENDSGGGGDDDEEGGEGERVRRRRSKLPTAKDDAPSPPPPVAQRTSAGGVALDSGVRIAAVAANQKKKTNSNSNQQQKARKAAAANGGVSSTSKGLQALKENIRKQRQLVQQEEEDKERAAALATPLSVALSAVAVSAAATATATAALVGVNASEGGSLGAGAGASAGGSSGGSGTGAAAAARGFVGKSSRYYDLPCSGHGTCEALAELRNDVGDGFKWSGSKPTRNQYNHDKTFVWDALKSMSCVCDPGE